MNIEEFRQYCLSMDGVTEKTPFGRFARKFDSLLVFYIHGHMFCSVDIDDFTYVDARSDPEEIEKIKAEYRSVGQVLNPVMKNWVRLELGGDIPDRMVYRFVSDAYRIVRNKYGG